MSGQPVLAVLRTCLSQHLPILFAPARQFLEYIAFVHGLMNFLWAVLVCALI